MVDDIISNLHLLVGMLSKHGSIISVAKSGEEAIELPKKTSLDLIFLDIMMAGMDGYTAGEDLKAIPDTRDIRTTSQKNEILLKAIHHREKGTRPTLTAHYSQRKRDTHMHSFFAVNGNLP